MVTRADLKAGEQVAQVAHATAEFAEGLPEAFSKWHTESKYIIVLAVPTLDDLIKLQGSLSTQGIKFVSNYEPDLYNTLTALAISPDEFTKVKPQLRHLPLALKT